jgi:nucleoside-diphosphate-sugar epimerase
VKVVVTGGAGFIGANLCRGLARTEAVTEVVALDDLASGFADNLTGIDAILVEGSILRAGHAYAAVVPASWTQRWAAGRSPCTATGCRAGTSPT